MLWSLLLSARCQHYDADVFEDGSGFNFQYCEWNTVNWQTFETLKCFLNIVVSCYLTQVNTPCLNRSPQAGTRFGLTENDGHENDGPNLRDIKLQNLRTLNTLALEIHAVTFKCHCLYAVVCDFYILYGFCSCVKVQKYIAS